MSSTQGHVSVTSAAKSHIRFELLYRSPILLLAAVAISVFVVNVAVAVFLRTPSQPNLPNHLLHHLLDSLLLLAFLLPALIFFVFGPTRLHLAQRRRAEEDLAAERNKLEKILDAMPAGVYIVNPYYEIEYTNSALLKEFGPVKGRTCHEYFKGCTDACPGCRIHEVFGGKSITWETVSDGTGKVYEIFDTPLQNADDTISKLSIVRDVTARKVAEYELRASRQQLRSLSVHQQRTREEERMAVSREIHDELGQVLATVQLGVSSLAEDHQDFRRLAGKIAGMEQLIARAIRTIRKIATQLRPSILDELGLAEAIEWQVAEFRTNTRIACSSDILLNENNFNANVATAVFRILQESLTNVIRHSAATRVAVTLEERNGRIVLIVADNGHGIHPEQLREGHSFGISGMRERAYALGGRVRLCRSRQQGTVVVAHIPVASSGGNP